MEKGGGGISLQNDAQQVIDSDLLSYEGRARQGGREERKCAHIQWGKVMIYGSTAHHLATYQIPDYVPLISDFAPSGIIFFKIASRSKCGVHAYVVRRSATRHMLPRPSPLPHPPRLDLSM